jgi:pimeloyl-ACP methyl ester carboxylesterase
MAVKEITYKNKRLKLGYDIVNPNSDIGILVLHGWGSSRDIMKKLFKDSFGDYRQTYLDLPGFGNSSSGDLVLTSQDYAYIVKIFLRAVGLKPTAIIGHSFGGKVATLLNPDILVLLSSAGIRVEKPLAVKAKIALFKFLKSIGLSDTFRGMFVADDAKGMSQSMYETFKSVVDEDFEKIFSNYRGRALIFWGKDDTATPPFTGEKIASLIQNSKFYLLDGDHYFFINHKELIAEKIIEELKRY